MRLPWIALRQSIGQWHDVEQARSGAPGVFDGGEIGGPKAGGRLPVAEQGGCLFLQFLRIASGNELERVERSGRARPAKPNLAETSFAQQSDETVAVIFFIMENSAGNHRGWAGGLCM